MLLKLMQLRAGTWTVPAVASSFHDVHRSSSCVVCATQQPMPECK